MKMATTISEIDSFMSKFKCLLANGVKATLTLEAVEGEAFVTLKAGLGSNLVPTMSLKPHGPLLNLKKPRSPSYFRRQEKRKQERQKAVEAKAEKATDISEDVLKTKFEAAEQADI